MFDNSFDWTQWPSRLLWTASALISLLSARYLLVESNYHFPLFLFPAQLIMTTAVVALRFLWNWKAESTGESLSIRSCMHRARLMTLAAMFFAALSMVCMLQAILHDKNLPTLIMLTAISFFTFDFLSLLFGYVSWSRSELLRVTLLLSACVGILMFEYRLSVHSLVSSIFAMLFAGIARALKSAAVQHDPKDIPNRTTETLYFLGASWFVGTVWLCQWPDRYLAVNELGRVPLPLLAINLIATTTTVLSGASTVFPLHVRPPIDEAEDDKTVSDEHKDALTLLALTALTGCYSALSARRSYTNWVQYCCFALAILCIGCKSAARRSPDGIHISKDSGIAYELLEEASLADDEEDHAIPSSTTILPWTLGWKPGYPLFLPRVALATGLLLLCILSVSLNYCTPDYNTESATLDRDYEPAVSMEVVLSMYTEPVGDVWNLIAGVKSASETKEAAVIIYTKDEDADVKNLKLRTGADEVIKLANIGREGETYLHHINTRWDNLAKHTIFLQADVHFDRQLYSRISNYFDADRTGFLNLGRAELCDCNACGDHDFWHDNVGLFPQYHNVIYNTTECNDILLSYKGSFIVSAARIRGIRRNMYNELWQAFVDKDSWAHPPQFSQGRSDSMNAPDLGYTIERMWSLLFQCSDMNVAWKCPSPISGWRLGGSIADCQCFDDDTPR